VTLPLGGRNLTRDVMNGLSVLEETAENVKKNINNPLDPNNVGNVVIEGVNATDAANYISSRNGEIIANINQQLADAGMKSDSLRSIVLIGGGSHLGGLAQKMEETMKIKVRLGQYPSSLNIINHDIHRIEYIEVLSLLAKAAEDIAPDETCLTLNNYDNTGFEIKTNSLGTASPEQPENKPLQVEIMDHAAKRRGVSDR